MNINDLDGWLYCVECPQKLHLVAMQLFKIDVIHVKYSRLLCVMVS